jgi:excisionase family DNA binding protein
MADDEHTEQWLSAKEAADLLALDAKTVRGMAAKGQIPALRAGRIWRFRRSVIESLGRGEPPPD